MGIMTIDGRKVEFTDEKNVLSVIRKAGINVPTLCYQPELSIYGSVPVCVQQKMREVNYLPPVQKYQEMVW